MTDQQNPQPTPAAPVPIQQRPTVTYDWGAQGTKSNRSAVTSGGGPTPQTPRGAYGRTATAPAPQKVERPTGLSDEAVDDLGKTVMTYGSAPDSPVLPEDMKAPERKPGFFEGMLSGLVDAFTGIVPDPIRGGLVRGAELTGEVLDIPGEALGHVPVNQLFGLEDLKGAYDKLMKTGPMTEAKRRTMYAIQMDPTEAEWYMSQYLRSHSGDYAAMKGLPQLLANLIRPDATIQERFFMGLGMPAQAVARLRAGGGLGVFGNRALDIINNPELNDPALLELRARYQRGEFGTPGSDEALDRLTDEIVTNGYGWHDDPFIGMLGEMFTDPLIIASMGTGVALGAVRTGALARHAQNVARLARTSTDNSVIAAVKRVDTLLEQDAIRTNRLYDLNSADSTYRFASEFGKEGVGKRISQQAMEELRDPVKGRKGIRGEKDYYAAKYSPAIETMAKASEMLNSPFGFFGKDGIGGVIHRKFSRDTSQGILAAYGMNTVGKVFDGVPNQAALQRSLGYAMAYTQRSMMQGNLIRMVRMRMEDAKGNILGNAKLPDTLSDPDTLYDRMSGYKLDRHGNRMKDKQGNYITTRSQEELNLQAQQAEVATRRWAKEYTPDLTGITKENRPRVYAHKMNQLREEAAHKLARAAGIDLNAARKVTANADEKMLSFIDYAHWGKTIEEFIQVQQVAIGRVQPNVRQAGVDAIAKGAGDLEYELASKQMDVYEIVNRATLVGENELTLQRALDIQKQLSSAKDEAEKLRIAQAAVAKYEVLHQNFYEKTRITTDAHFISRVEDMLRDGLDNERYVAVLNPKTLADDVPELAAFRQTLHDSGAPYEIGIAPSREKRWAPVKNDKGELVGFYPWMDIRVTPEEMAKPTRFDRMRDRLMTPIRGENMMQESRRKFTSHMNREYGLSRQSTNALWDQIREKARDQRITMRGFTVHEFEAIMRDVNLPDWEKQQLGNRGLARAVAAAMEGDLAMVGLTSKATGMMKTRTAKYANFVGVLSEKIYPLVRFNMNPIFWVQEFIEPYFFNVLRGVKPGYRFGPETVTIHNLLDEFNMAEHLADGFEAREFMMAGSVHARAMAGPGTSLHKIDMSVFGGTMPTAKRVNYYQEVRKLFGEQLHEAMEREMPGQWMRLETVLSEIEGRAGRNTNLSKGEVAELYFKHKGGAMPDQPWATVHHYDGAVPNEFGQIRGITTSYLAKHMGYPDAAHMRQAALDPLSNLNEWTFKEKLVSRGFSNEYANRAWGVAVGPDVKSVLDSIEGDFADKGVVGFHRDLAEALLNRAAVTKGISVDELVARKFTGGADWLDHNARLPLRAYTQLANRLGLEWDLPPLERTDPRFEAFQQRVMEKFPQDPPAKATLTGHINAARKEYEGKTKPVLPTQVKTDRTVAGLKLQPGKNADDFKTWIEKADLNAADVQDIALWYEELSGMFGGLAYGMDEATVNMLKPLLPDPNIGLEDAKAEIGARLFMSWMSTQVQQSPQKGLQSALMLMDEVARGKRASVHAAATNGDWKPHRYGVQSAKYYAMLRDFDKNLPVEGFGVKLYDFSDSSIAEVARSFSRYTGEQMHKRLDGSEHPLQPGAMDIWAMRERGFIDNPMLDYLAKRLARQEGLSYEDAHIRVQIETGFVHQPTVLKWAQNKKGVWEAKKSPEPAGPYLRQHPIYEKDGKTVKSTYVTREIGYKARIQRFNRDHNLTGDKEAGKVWGGTPSPAEYEKALKQYNDLADELNSGDGWMGRGYESGNPWTVREVQAIAWVQMRNEFQVGDYNIQHFNSAQLQFTNNPSPHAPMYEKVPLHRATEHARDIVSVEVARGLRKVIEARTGVTFTRTMPGTTGSTHLGGITDNTFWEVMGSPTQLQDAARMLAYLTQSDIVHGLKPSEKTSSGKSAVWALDFAVSEANPRVLDKLGRWLDEQGLEWNGYGTGTVNDGRLAVRTVMDPNDKHAGAKKVPQSMDLARFEKELPLDAGVEAKLRDGSWATEAGFDHPIVVEPNRMVYDNYSVNHEWATDPDGAALLKEMRDDGRGHLADKIATDDVASITALADAALRDADPDAWAAGRAVDDVVSQGRRSPGEADPSAGAIDPTDPGLPQQRGINSRGQPVWNAATKWASDADDAQRIVGGQLRDRRGTLVFREGRADATSVAHELLHIFADDLDPSAVKSIHAAFLKSADGKKYLDNGGSKPGPKQRRVILEAEEWMAYQFEEWLATGVAPNGTMNAVFMDYADYYKTIRSFTGQNVDPELAALFDKMNPEMHKGPKATYDVDEYRMMEVARVALLRAEEEAFKTHYYKRGRTWLERSINHPYLGLYPASYMWGKVLPELMKFLVRKPFGVDAPFAGAAMANHVYEAIQLEMNTDDGTLATFVEDFPEAMRFLQLLVPGTPWDIPVNAPAWSRRLAQDVWQDREPNLGRALSDTAGYAFGAGRSAGQIVDVAADAGNMVSRIHQMATGQYESPSEKEAREEQEKYLRSVGAMPPEGDESDFNLVPGR